MYEKMILFYFYLKFQKKNGAFIQLASVKPYFDDLETNDRPEDFDRRVDVDLFYLDSEYVKTKNNEKPPKNPLMHQIWYECMIKPIFLFLTIG
jgi:hypothetical protein